jgi:hypothetical protein
VPQSHLRTWLSQLHVIGAEKLAAHLAHRNRCTATFSREQEDFNNSTKTLEAISLAAELAAAPTTLGAALSLQDLPGAFLSLKDFPTTFRVVSIIGVYHHYLRILFIIIFILSKIPSFLWLSWSKLTNICRTFCGRSCLSVEECCASFIFW